MEHTQPKHRPLAIWNPVTDRWELEQETIFGHSDAYSETWPTSGMTVNGVAYELPTWEHRTGGTGSSSLQHDEGLLRTPTASEVSGGMMHPDRCKAENKTLRLASQMVELANPGQLLPTPLANEAEKAWIGKRESKGQKYLSHIIGEHLLPTPTTSEATGAWNGPKKSGGENLRKAVPLLATPNTMDMLPAREGEALQKNLQSGGRTGRTKTGNLREQVIHCLPQPTGESMPRLFVDGRPVEEPPLPLQS